MKKFTIALLVLVGLVSILALYAYTTKLRTSTHTPETYVIGGSLPSKLPDEADMLLGATLAYNEGARKIGGVDIMLDIRDDTEGDGYSDRLLKENANIFVQDKRSIAFYGPSYSTAAKKVLGSLNKAGIAVISPSASLPSLTKPGFAINEPTAFLPTNKRNFVRIFGTDDLDAMNTVMWARELGHKTCIIADDRTLDFTSTAIYQRYLGDVGIDLLSRTTVSTSSAKDRAMLIKKQVPDFVYYQGFDLPTFTALVTELRRIDFQGDIMTSDSILGSIKEQDKHILKGLRITTFNTPLETLNNPSSKKFIQKFTAAYGRAPSGWAAQGYESMRVLLNAINRAKQDGDISRENVTKKLLATREFPTMYGRITFNDQGDNLNMLLGRGSFKDGRVQIEKYLSAEELFK